MGDHVASRLKQPSIATQSASRLKQLLYACPVVVGDRQNLRQISREMLTKRPKTAILAVSLIQHTDEINSTTTNEEPFVAVFTQLEVAQLPPIEICYVCLYVIVCARKYVGLQYDEIFLLLTLPL